MMSEVNSYYLETRLLTSSGTQSRSDATRDGPRVAHNEILHSVLQLRGSNTARVTDIADIREYIRSRLDRFESQVRRNLKPSHSGRSQQGENGRWSPHNMSSCSNLMDTSSLIMTRGTAEDQPAEALPGKTPVREAMSATLSELAVSQSSSPPHTRPRLGVGNKGAVKDALCSVNAGVNAAANASYGHHCVLHSESNSPQRCDTRLKL